jgi:peptidoglycan/LPS O-acetylase OafA/YrhL
MRLLKTAPVSASAIRHRVDIDGLRAIAILLVLFFHVGLPGFSGGFVGVDIFFVISGYLITQVISREMEAGVFSIPRFYERRVRRILPALFVVVVFVAVLSTLLMAPYELRQTARAIIAALSFTANFEFWRQSGYFGVPAQLLPLLHTWSLAIEEQFYLLYPLVLYGMRNRQRRELVVLLVVGFMISFAFCIWLTRDHQGAAFYSTPSRAWELLLGCLMAMAPTQNFSRPFREGAALVGMTAIAGSVTMISSATQAEFPGYIALLPCAGTAILLYVNARCPTFTGRLLGSRPVVAIGLISYSLYLWHWPLLTFARIWFYGSLPPVTSISVLAVSFVLASASWKWIEQPFREKGGILPRRALFAAAGGIALLLGIIGASALATNGWPQRFDPKTAALSEYEDYQSTALGKRLFGRPGCHTGQTNSRSYDVARCFSLASGKKNILLWGDSHAGHFALVLTELLTRQDVNLMQASKPACPPLLLRDVRMTPDCLSFNAMIAKRIASGGVDVLVLSANWAPLLDESGGRGPGTRYDALLKTLQAFRARGIEIILVGQSPRYVAPLPMILAHAAATGAGLEEKSLGALDPDIFAADKLMKDSFGAMPGVTYISILDALCPQKACQATTAEGIPMLFDMHHFTYEGARFVTEKSLRPAILHTFGRHAN